MRKLLLVTAVATLVLVVALAVGLGAAVGAATPQAACGKLLPPSQGILFGNEPAWTIAPVTYDDIPSVVDERAFEDVSGRRVVVAPFNMSWHDGLPFPTQAVTLLWREGYVPEIRLFSFPVMEWAPTAPPPPGPIPNSDIAAGKHDAELRRFADAARATDIPIEFDYDGEITAPSHPWSGTWDGGGVTTGYGDPNWPDGPEHVRDAYRRIITIFREEGATNVTFMFHVNAVSGYLPGTFWEPWDRFQWYYPGDDYIDWLGISVYSEPKFLTGPNESFEDVLAFPDTPGYEGPYAELTALGSKPVVINEMGFDKMPSEEAKAQWIEDASAVLRSGRYPRIKAINWLGQNYDTTVGYGGWPGTSQTLLDAFKAAFDQPFFDAKPQFSGDCRPLAPAKVTYRDGVLTWTAVPNAAGYQIWRGSTLLRRTDATSATVGRAHDASYKVRGVDLVGVGPFATTTTKARSRPRSP